MRSGEFTTGPTPSTRSISMPMPIRGVIMSANMMARIDAEPVYGLERDERAEVGVPTDIEERMFSHAPDGTRAGPVLPGA